MKDTRGTATVEYAVVLVFVALVGIAALMLIGVPLIERFRLVQSLINLPIP